MATHSISCLENPKDGGAWGAAIYEITQSQTRLKRLSSSSSSSSGICLQDFPSTRGNGDSTVGGHKQNLVCSRTQGSSDRTEH